MPDPIDIEVQKHSEDSIQRELFGTRVGFILAAVGSAVGLGNMWRFPYRVAEGGGAAFVTLYIILTLIMGIPLMLSEFAIGRRTRLSPIGAFKKEGGKSWGWVGFLGVLTGFLILSYYSVIAGWVVRYGIEGIMTGFAADPGQYFGEVTTGIAPIVYHVMFMLVTVTSTGEMKVSPSGVCSIFTSGRCVFRVLLKLKTAFMERASSWSCSRKFCGLFPSEIIMLSTGTPFGTETTRCPAY